MDAQNFTPVAEDELHALLDGQLSTAEQTALQARLAQDPAAQATLMAWRANFDAAWPELSKNPRYDERFRRMWRYYLAVSAATFRTRRDQLWQITMSPRGVRGGYRVPR